MKRHNMERDVAKINAQLRENTKTWYEYIISQYPELTDYKKYSSPFCFGLSEKEFSTTKEKTIMIVGEEAASYWFDKHENEYDIIQEFVLTYFEKQIFKEENREKYKKYYDAFPKNLRGNGSRFWCLFRELAKTYNVCWNNLDKIHGVYLNKENKRETYALNNSGQNLQFQVNANEKSLLLEEIEIVKPDVLIFLGGNYYDSISNALNITIPNYKKPIIIDYENIESEENRLAVDITSYCNNISQKVIWINHPNARKSRKNSVFNAIISAIRDIINK